MATTLYGSPSTASMVVHWLLIELDLPHNLYHLDFEKREHKSPDYLKINPVGVVPALVAWPAVLWAAPGAAVLLVAGFVAHYAQDRRLVAQTGAALPAWYLPLRTRLTLVASVCLLVGAATLLARTGG